MEEQFREVCQFFCETPKTTEPGVFFSIFQKFIHSYKATVNQLDAQLNEEQTAQKAKTLQAQSKKMKETAAINAKLAAQAMERRRSELYDQNENVVFHGKRSMSTADTLDNVTIDRLSMSCPRSSSLQSIHGPPSPAVATLSELNQCPLFLRTKLRSESDPDILDSTEFSDKPFRGRLFSVTNNTFKNPRRTSDTTPS